MIFALGWIVRIFATIFFVGAITQRLNCASGNPDAQLSKICTASAPASICSHQMQRDTLAEQRRATRSKPFGLAIAPELRRLLLIPATTGRHIGRQGPGRARKAQQACFRYRQSLREHAAASHRPARAFPSSQTSVSRSRPSALADRRQRRTLPSVKLTVTCPAQHGTIRISEKIIAASNPKRRIGCSVISARHLRIIAHRPERAGFGPAAHDIPADSVRPDASSRSAADLTSHRSIHRSELLLFLQNKTPKE